MPRKEKKFHYIYKTICKVTNRYYIGMHSTDNLDDGYLGSGTRLRYSIRKHGKDNHIREILEFCANRESLAKRESEIVNEQLLTEDLCMNLKEGGNGGGSFTIESQQKGGQAFAERLKEDTDLREKMAKVTGDTFRKLHSEGKIRTDTFKGKRHSEETKKKISEANRNKRNGSKNSQFGTCWVTNGSENKKIKKEELDNWISLGYSKGRKM